MRHAGLRDLALCAAFVLAVSCLAPRSQAAPAGKAIYEAQCAACHQPDGAGAAGLAPPLRDHLAHYLATADGRTYLATILVSGMVGPITVDGAPFSGLMPSFATLDDEALAATMNYVLATMNKVDVRNGGGVAAEDVAKARLAGPAPVGTRKLRQKIVLSGN